MTGALPSKSEPPSPPVHIAIIMDGNGRWAKARGLPRIEGHRKGAGAVRRVVRSAADLGVSYLTIYGFSSENWQRPQAEVRDLMGLLRLYLRSEVAELHRNGVRIRIIGERERLAADINELIDGAEERTKSNTRLNLVIALSYGGRSEIARAARRLAEEVLQGGIRPEEIDARTFERYLATVGVPDPDLVIRTGGELRLSNFLLWQSAYAELIFTERLWPDFDRADLESAIGEFQRRERRYGASSG